MIEPRIRAYLYTWGDGRTTAEGEHIPVRIENLDLGVVDGMLLLPLIEEHEIDERSPLCGYTCASLAQVCLAASGQLALEMLADNNSSIHVDGRSIIHVCCTAAFCTALQIVSSLDCLAFGCKSSVSL